ncbi:MAG: quinone-dependent dihydroorotate dehydrogenase [Planctomycetes bacterium]|nr:quinone-dependent dihydroorotate dehydrogenase [Planctomycetota bacterium]
MDPYRDLLRPALFRKQPESAHDLAMGCLALGSAFAPLCRGMRALLAPSDPRLALVRWGRSFNGPIGLAAGLDKEAVGIEALAALGFSHLEVGTVTGQAQPGNPKPRAFRLVRDEALINRMGFNNHGAAAMAARLARRYDQAGGARRPPCPLGINLGKTKVVELEHAAEDYARSVRALGRLADYVVVNVSSPNTPGLRDLQGEAHLRPLLEAVRRELDEVAPGTPLLLKIAPDLADAGIDAAVDVALEARLDGLIATNTTITRDGLRTDPAAVAALGAGGLSGAPLRARSDAVLARVARRIAGRVPVIGVGGVDSAESAWRKIGLGASLVQVYTAFIYHGPLLVRRIHAGLSERVARAGLRSIDQAVGRDL